MKKQIITSRLNLNFLFLSLLFFTLSSCSNPTSEKGTEPKIQENGTAKMVALLKEVNAQIDPMKVNYHLNANRAENLKTRLAKTDDLYQNLQTNAQFAYELLNAGKSTEAIVELQKLIDKFVKNNIDKKNIYNLKRLLAVAYMRLGEQDNCIAKNNSESCIIPIKGEGVYSLKKGSESAISIYKEMLRENPNDLESLWMMNIAYMTLGEYPEKVPSQWRIPESVFQSDFTLPAFKNVANHLGINTLGLSGGSCVDDFNNDGLLDIIASSWGVNDQVKIFFNNGDGTFKDHTEESGIKGITGGLNMIHADYNNDGFKDVLILRGAWFADNGRMPNSLLKNNGDGTFSDVTFESGLFSRYPTQTACWADFNNDGWLDLFIGNEGSSKINAPCELFLNEKGVFKNITDQAKLSQIQGVVKGVTAGDVNNDGWPDIYVSILGQANQLLLNRGVSQETPNLQFINIASKVGVQEPVESFPTWMWDYDNDGFLDIFVGAYNISAQNPSEKLAYNLLGNEVKAFVPKLFRNNGNGTFSEMSEKMGLTEPIFAMGSNFGDLDNDGFLDFYIGTGSPSFTSLVPNKMYRNNKGKSFQDVTTSGRFGHIQKGHGVSFGDLDNDGDQDIFHVLGGAYEGDVFGDALFENPIGNQKSWISLELEGTISNKSAIGARIIVTTSQKDGSKQSFHALVSTGGSFGASSLRQEIGLDEAVTIKKIEIKWPNASKKVAIFTDIRLNQLVKIVEGKTTVEYLERRPFRLGVIQ